MKNVKFVGIIIAILLLVGCGGNSTVKKNNGNYNEANLAENEANKAFDELENGKTYDNNTTQIHKKKDKEVKEPKQETKKGYAKSKERPDWTIDQPHNNGYYIGIGMSKDTGNKEADLQRAKNNALLEISSQIKVKITSEVVDIQQEVNEQMGNKRISFTKENMKRKINTFTDEILEGVELVDSWTSDPKSGYWFYYRLDKTKFRNMLQQKFNNAKKRAIDFFYSALKYEREYKIVLAIQNYMDALAEIENYFYKPIKTTLDGKDVILQIFIKQKLEELFDYMVISSRMEQYNIVKGSIPRSVQVKVTFKGRFVNNMPLKIKIVKGEGDVLTETYTSNVGKATIHINSLIPDNGNVVMEIVPDLKKLLSGYPKEKYGQTYQLISQLNIASLKINFSFNRLKVYFDLSRTVNDIDVSPVVSKIKNELIKKSNIEFVSSKEKYNYSINVDVKLRKGNVFNGIYFAYAHLTIRIYGSSGKQVGEVGTKEVKNGGLNYDQAFSRCINQLKDLITDEVVNQLNSKLKY